MVFVDEPLQMLAQFPFSKDHESHVGQLLHDEMSGFDEMTLPFVRHERPDSTHNEGMMRKEECLVNVHRRHCDNLLNVEARRSTSLLRDYAPLAGRDVRLTLNLKL